MKRSYVLAKIYKEFIYFKKAWTDLPDEVTQIINVGSL